MKTTTLWFRVDGQVFGPVGWSDCEHLVRGGRIGPETEVSVDRVRWFPARRVRGLFEAVERPGDGPTRDDPLELVQGEGPGEDGRTDGGPGVGGGGGVLAGPATPVLRVRRRLLRHEVIAIYDDEFIKGTRFRGRLPITEEMCRPSGKAALIGLIGRVRRIPFDRVVEATEQGPRRVSFWTEGNMARVKLRLEGGRKFRFKLQPNQRASVRGILADRLGDRFRTRDTPRNLRLGLLLGFLGLLCSLPAAASVGLRLWEETIVGALALAGPSIVLAATSLGLAGVFLFGRTGAWVSGSQWPATARPEPSRRRRRSASREPWRSTWIGWALKLAGVVYWFYLASPFAESWRSAIDGVIGNNFQISALIWTVISAPTPLAIYFGHRLSLRRYNPAQPKDARRPIVFLRPFEDDLATSLQPPGWVAQAVGIRWQYLPRLWQVAPRPRRMNLWNIVSIGNPLQQARWLVGYGGGTSEESMVRYFEQYGPVVAIGRPGERLAAPGAARMYVDDAAWQDAVVRELGRAQAVVVQPGVSEGVAWELDQIRARIEPYRVLVVLVGYWRNPQAYEDLRALVRRCMNIELPRDVPFRERPCFVDFDRDWAPRVQELSYKPAFSWPLTTDAANLTYTLQPFLQGMHGGDREPPRPARRMAGLAHAFACLGALLVAITIGIGAVSGAQALGNGVMAVFGGGSLPADLAATTAPGPEDPWFPAPRDPADPAPVDFRKMVSNPPDPADPAPVEFPSMGDASPPSRGMLNPVTLSGRAVPYHFEAPGDLKVIDGQNPLIDHVLQTADGRLTVQVIASGAEEDVSDFPAIRLRTNQAEGAIDCELKSRRVVTRGNASWQEGRITAIVAGREFLEISRATSSPSGTLIVIVISIPSNDGTRDYDRLGEEILDSFRLTPATGGADDPPIGAPVR